MAPSATASIPESHGRNRIWDFGRVADHSSIDNRRIRCNALPWYYNAANR